MFLDLLLVTVALVGHFATCVALFNRFHAYHLQRLFVFCFDRAMAVSSILAVGMYAYRGLTGGAFVWNGNRPVGWEWLLIAHAAYGIFATLLVFPLWIWPRLIARRPAAFLREESRVIELSKTSPTVPLTHGAKANFLARLPGNDILTLTVNTKELRLPRWPKALDGLSIVHLSDLHITGRLTQPFYEAVVREVAALNGDLIAIAGDILEVESCLPWVVPTFGKLRAPLGKVFVLGNHELRLPDPSRLRREMAAAGWLDVSGQTLELTWQGEKFYLAGNEWPWFGVPPQVPASDQPRVLLAHTPDLFPSAQQDNYDLMLAGHTHGGQIRFPIFGALISPSAYGFRYAAGVFHEGPTVLHVSRGISGEHLLRWNCTPEITKLVLRSGV